MATKAKPKGKKKPNPFAKKGAMPPGKMPAGMPPQFMKKK